MLISQRLIKVSLLSLTLWYLKPTHALAFSDTNFQGATKTIRAAYEREFFSGYPNNNFQPNQQNHIVGNNNLFAIPPEMGGISEFSEGLAVVKVNGKYGYMDTSGTVVIPAQFDEAHAFSEGLAAARLGEKWGYINPQGQFVISASEGLLAARLGKKWGYINPQGQFVISAHFQGFPGKFSDGLATMHLLSGETGVIDREGKWIIAPQFNVIRDFSEGLAAIAVEGKYGYIDKMGQIVIEPQFEEAGAFSQGLAPVRVNLSNSESGWGYIDKTGKVVIAPQFHGAQSFSNGLAAVVLAGNQWGYIDLNGTVIIPGKFYTPQYFPYSSTVTPFSSDGVAMARVGEKVGFINRKGEWIIQPTFSDGTDFGDGLARVNSGGIWMPGVADPTHLEGSVPVKRLYGGVWGYIRVVPPSP